MSLEELIDTLLTSADDKIKENTTRSLIKLAGAIDDNARVLIAEKGGIPPLISLLSTGSDETKALAALALCKLAINENNDNLIAKHGGIPPLITLLSANDKIAEYAVCALLNLTVSNTDNRTLIAEKGGIPLLIALLSTGTPEAKEKAVMILTNLTFDSISRREIIGKEKGIPPLITFLSAGSNCAQENAVCALLNLSTIPNTCALLAKEGEILPFIHVLETGSEHAKENSLGVLVNLAFSYENIRILIGEKGGIPPIITFLSNGTPSARERAAGVLGLMAQNRSNKVLISESGGILPLIHILSTGLQIAMKNAAITLGRLDEFVAKEGIPSLINILSDGSDSGKEWALYILHKLVYVNKMNDVKILVGEKAIPALITLLYGGTSTAIKYAAAILNELSVDDCITVSITENGGILPLITLLSVNSGPAFYIIHEHATGALLNLCSVSTNKLLIAKNGIPSLVSLLTNGYKETKKNAVEILWILAEDDDNLVLIAENGGLPPLITLISSITTTFTKEKAFSKLIRLISDDKNRVLITEKGGIPSLIVLLSTGTEDLKSFAIGVFLSLVKCDKLKDVVPDSMMSVLEGQVKSYSGPKEEDVKEILAYIAANQPEWKCRYHGITEHDVFINYRVATDGQLAKELAFKIHAEIPGNPTVFLDSLCLPFGENWQQSFVKGLLKSKFVVLLVSGPGIQNIKNAHQKQDNVLLEYEYAHQRSVDEGITVIPVLIGKEIKAPDDNGVMVPVFVPFKIPNLDLFPDLPHKVREFPQIKKTTETVRETMKWLFSVKSLRLTDTSNLTALVSCCDQFFFSGPNYFPFVFSWRN